MSKYLKFVVGFVAIAIFFLFAVFPAEAQENEYDFDTQKITFTLTEKNGNIDSQEKENQNNTDQAANQSLSKPVGKLPSTGELLKTNFIIGGLLLIVMAVMVLVIKKMKVRGRE